MKKTVDLKPNSGLDLKLDAAVPNLIFGEGLTAPQAAIRNISEMQEVLMDHSIKEPYDLYYMYRDVHRLKDSELLNKYKLLYDVTVIKPDRLGKELMKTAGHYHPGSFGELYEVVWGECFCMLQRPKVGDHKIIEEVIVVRAEAGEKIVIPPQFGHILINPGPEYLVTSNWVSSEFSSEYDLYKKAQGAAYFVTLNKAKVDFIANAYFTHLPEIKFVTVVKCIDKFGLLKGAPIYPIINDAKRLDFLNRPLDFDYADVFVEDTSEISIK